MINNSSLLIAAGGTGGHIFPGIAVAQDWVVHGGDVVFVGTGRAVEENIFQKNNVRSHTLSVTGRLKGEGIFSKIKTLLSLPLAFWKAIQILRQEKPHVVLGVGGYSSGPVIVAAWFLRIPRTILEPNSLPGLTNKLLAPFASRIYLSFSETEKFFPKKKILFTGVPVRASLAALAKHQPCHEHIQIVILGGSLGARSLNEACLKALPIWAASGHVIRVLHQTGAADFERVNEAYEELMNHPEIGPKIMPKIMVDVRAFVEDMEAALMGADLVVSRSGASTLAELIESQRPSVLVPYPYAADNHQHFNALSVSKMGGAILVEDREIGEKLASVVLELVTHRQRLGEMREALSGLRKVRASEAVVKDLVKLCTPL